MALRWTTAVDGQFEASAKATGTSVGTKLITG